MRVAAVLATLVVLTACAGGTSTHRGGTLSKKQFLSAVQAVPAPMRTGSTGAPIVGLVVSGTITNDGTAPLRCTASAFVLVSPSSGNDVAPSTQFCAVPTIAPQQSSYFNVTFAAAPRNDLRLRFEHGDGSYEIHDLAVPPG